MRVSRVSFINWRCPRRRRGSFLNSLVTKLAKVSSFYLSKTDEQELLVRHLEAW